MIKLLLVPLIPIFVMCAKVVIEDAMQRYRSRATPEPKRRKRAEPKMYDHEWDDDDE